MYVETYINAYKKLKQLALINDLEAKGISIFVCMCPK